MNQFNGIGRIGRDAVTRHTTNGKPVTGWSMAIETGFGDNKQTTWLDCSLWGDRGEKVAGYIVKGDRIGVCGEIGTREHDGKTYVTLNVRDFTLLGDKKDKPAQSRQTPSEPQKSTGGATGFEDDIPFGPLSKRSHF